MFLNKVTATKIDDNTWQLERDLTYVNSKHKITAKAGLKTDFASIPRIAWTLVGSPAMGRYTSSSVIHDVLYATEYFNRKACDELFLEMLKAENVGYFKRYAMYWAVRSGGWLVWKKHNPKQVLEDKKYIKVEK